MKATAKKPIVASTLSGLQALRASAAFLVVASHAILTLGEKTGAQVDRSFAWFLGELGVDIFFVISGFVMVHSHSDDFGKLRAPRRFMIRRIGRITPLYWLTTVVYSIKLILTNNAPSVSSFLQSLFFIPFQRPGAIYGRPVYELGWTLQYEMAFYSVMALALFWEYYRGLALIVVIFLSLVGLQQAQMLGADNPLAYWGAPIVLYFLIGVAIAVVRRSFGSTALGPLQPGFSGAILTCLAALSIAVASRYWLGEGSFSTMIAIFASIAATASCALAVETPEPSLGKTIAKGLGDSTYSIYLTHSFIVGPAGRVAAECFQHLPVGVFIALMVPAAAILGLVTYRFVEVPMMKCWSRRLAT